jgi:hypothetical protein
MDEERHDCRAVPEPHRPDSRSSSRRGNLAQLMASTPVRPEHSRSSRATSVRPGRGTVDPHPLDKPVVGSPASIRVPHSLRIHQVLHLCHAVPFF